MKATGKNLKTAKALSLAVFCFLASGCAAFHSRPIKQMAYAESAYQAALSAGADSNPDTISIFQLARDQLARARSYYRLKNFKNARFLAVKSRRLSEEAEWKAMRGNSNSNAVESLVK
jgi:hypothetical protein